MKVLFPIKGEAEKRQFYAKLQTIREQAVSSEYRQDGFYDTWRYVMPDGKVYEYTENADYGVPYSIEKV